jgi:DNA mismatch repair protein MutL
MGKIQRLPVAVVNQIAAGEVIERPASVVKELLENALDAGATRIEITVEQGGRDLIRVWDNGNGIAADDLTLAVAPHATSKLETADDLFRVNTFGFRGEALASIASVSHLKLQSRPADQDSGAQIEVRDTEAGPVVACGCPTGTMVEVRNLFYNTPVRRRYLKAMQTEVGHIVEAFTRVAIAHPGLAAVLRHNDRTLFDLPASAQLLERLTLFFGRELAEKLIWVDSESEGHRLLGYAADPSQSRSNSRTQYIFVNGRFIRDRSLSHALSEAYRSLLMVGRYPVAFLFLEVPAEEVDVNVHPTKIEVRFRDPQRHFRQLLSALRQKFLATDLTARLQISSTPAPTETAEVDTDQPSLDDFFARATPATADSSGSNAPPALDSTFTRPAQSAFQLQSPLASPRTAPLPFPSARTAPPPVSLGTADPTSPTTDPVTQPQNPAAQLAATSPFTTHDSPIGSQQPAGSSGQLAALQIHNSYIVVETPGGLMLIDQHALHERVLYEELRSRVLGGALESQRLLVPEILELSAAEVALVADSQELLERLGMNVEPFGGTSVALHTYPAMLANLPADRMFRDIVDTLVGGSEAPSRRDLLDNLLHMISCKAAIKAGQRLTNEEIQSLVAQHHLAQDSHHCPHGRPTALVFSKAELEKQFKRI